MIEGFASYRVDAGPHKTELYVGIERLKIDVTVDDVVQSRDLDRARIVVEGELRHIERVWTSLHSTIQSIHASLNEQTSHEADRQGGDVESGDAAADIEQLRRAQQLRSALIDAGAEIAHLRGVLERVLMSCLLDIRRAAFAPEIGSRYTEAIRSDIGSACRRLEDTIRGALG